ncbi:MAG TPA: polynucleotide adenylyltransferase, partial [Spirochaetia bacterium]|nr:polynucleotide adenylyltransferase [Spirochaetia bacterium]
MNIPEHVLAVMNTLEAGGHKAFLVGGCVRDTLLSRPPQDYDITTCAAPNRVSD